jgi:hypothetical protein
MHNKKAENLMKEGLKELSFAYFNKITMLDEALRLAKEPSAVIDVTTNMQIKSENYQKGVYIGLAKIFDAGLKLGIKSEEFTHKTNPPK